MTLSQRLREYIAAAFTGIWIQSHEHHDALAEIAQLCRDQKWSLAVWDIDRGLQTSGQAAPRTTDPLAAIRALSSMASKDNSALLVLPNFHRFIQSTEIVQALARQIQEGKGPLVAVNCAAVPAALVESELFGHVRGAFTGASDHRVGRFEQANGGTLLIDEIGDFELSLQAKLLRVMETFAVTPVGGATERKADVRVVAATSRDLHSMVREGTFREDLFYRLNVVSISLPPLRERAGDVRLLMDYFAGILVRQKRVPARRISAELMECLTAYRWPGNVRELRNGMESMMVMGAGETLELSDLPEWIASRLDGETRASRIRGVVPGESTIADLQRSVILARLEHNAGDRLRTCRQLGISRRTLSRKLRQYLSDAGATEQVASGA